MELIDMYRTFHPKTAEHTLSSSAHGTFSRIEHMLFHKQFSINLRRLNYIKHLFLTTVVWDYKSTIRKKTTKNTNTWTPNNTLLNDQWVTEEIKEEIKKYLEINENGNTMIQSLWDAAKASLREKFIVIGAYLRKQEKSQTI